MTLTWTPAIDQLGPVRYAIYQDGSRIAVVQGTVLSFTVNGLVYGIPYSFQVEAMDPWGNWSANGPSALASAAPWWLYVATILGTASAVAA